MAADSGDADSGDVDTCVSISAQARSNHLDEQSNFPLNLYKLDQDCALLGFSSLGIQRGRRTEEAWSGVAFGEFQRRNVAEMWMQKVDFVAAFLTGHFNKSKFCSILWRGNYLMSRSVDKKVLLSLVLSILQ